MPADIDQRLQRVQRAVDRLELEAEEHGAKAGYTGMHAEREVALNHAVSILRAALAKDQPDA